MSKDILYGIKFVEIEELDPLTQLPKLVDPSLQSTPLKLRNSSQ